MYIRKTRDVYHIMTNYGYGWENEIDEYSMREAKQSVKEYLENCKGIQIYIKKGREKIKEDKQ